MSTFRDQLYIAAIQGLLSNERLDWQTDMYSNVAIDQTKSALKAYCDAFGHDFRSNGREQVDGKLHDVSTCDRCDVREASLVK